jgi:hypothetical protein
MGSGGTAKGGTVGGGTSGATNGGSAGGGTSGTSSGGCQKGQVKAKEVVFMGESFYAIAPQYNQKRVEANAQKAGALGASDTYRNVAISGQPLNNVIPGEFDTAHGRRRYRLHVVTVRCVSRHIQDTAHQDGQQWSTGGYLHPLSGAGKPARLKRIVEGEPRHLDAENATRVRRRYRTSLSLGGPKTRLGQWRHF